MKFCVGCPTKLNTRLQPPLMSAAILFLDLLSIWEFVRAIYGSFCYVCRVSCTVAHVPWNDCGKESSGGSPRIALGKCSFRLWLSKTGIVLFSKDVRFT